MGQTHASGTFFHSAAIREHFTLMPSLWTEHDLSTLVDRLKDMTLNFSLDKVKFGKLLQLSVSYEESVAKWFVDFSHDRASQVVDGLEFLSAAIMLSSKVTLFRKICLLFGLFDLDKTGVIRKDEFTIFLKAITTGLHRMVAGVPPPATVLELGTLSSEFFGTLQSQVLSQRELLMWMTEAHYSLHYLSLLSRLGTALFAWGTNHRYQLGLSMEPRMQRVPAPVLPLEGLRIAKVASNESHCLLLTEDGQVWSCGSGFCGLLGHGDTKDSPQPRIVEALSHTRVVDVAVGIRHSVAISEKGQVFSWGSADMGQLGHGGTEDREVHEWAPDPKNGGTFAYVVKPTVVMTLFGQRITARAAACCSFSTAVLTDQGHLYTWGNNTDGQCGQGQKCPDHSLIYVDPHMQRTAMQALLLPRQLQVPVVFQKIACGGYHMLAIDDTSRLWTWGRGLWGVLGHGDQRSMYDPKLVDTLRYHICNEVAAGEVHSICLTSLYRLTITGSNPDIELSPFSLLGLPAGRVDRQMALRQRVTPPNTSLQLNAFLSAKILQLPLPPRHDPDALIVDPAQIKPADIQDSIVLIDRSLWEGEWLRLDSSDFDFCVKMSTSGAQLPARHGVSAPIMYAVEGTWEPATDCVDKICVFECPPAVMDKTEPQDITPVILDIAIKCQQGQAFACVFVLPPDVEVFDVQAAGMVGAPEGMALQQISFGVMSNDHGAALKKHITRMINMRIATSPENVPEEVRDWKQCREEFTGRTYFENEVTGEKRWAPPQINPQTQASLLVVREDGFLRRLQAVLDLKPRGVIVCQQSWRPDVELVTLPESLMQTLEVPVVMVTFEAGEELKGVAANGSRPWVTMEIQPYGGVCAWGNGSYGQLGLSGIENQNFLTKAQNVLTGEQNLFTSKPSYIAHLHEHQVLGVACGHAHTAAVTQQGEVFTWGMAEGLGVPLDRPMSEVPMFVEQLEGLVRARKVYAGHCQTFAMAEMPFKSIV